MKRSVLPEPLTNLIDALSNLPGLGKKSATRLAFFILRSKEEFAESLAKAILDAKRRVTLCSVCLSFTSDETCRICSDKERDTSTVCVVEEPLDLIAIERSGEYRGTYHVLHGVISPIDGVGPEDLRIGELIKRLDKGEIKEVIIATNPTVEGEATALYLAKLIKPLGIKVSRIAHGIPLGGDIEYTDELTLGRALKERKEI